MQMFRPPLIRPDCLNPSWCNSIFATKSALNGGIVRRAVRDVEREIGRDMLVCEVRRRGFHLVECNGQYIIICNPGQIRVVC